MTAPSTAQITYAQTGALVDELVRSGVHHFCVCPGSRSTPLALTIAQHPTARLWMHLDERSAAFFGLGLAKQCREPVALVCTSGTAAANFLPAVVEAYHGRVPLVVLTADRPHELRGNGAPQTIDQINLYGSHAKWFVDLAEPIDIAGLDAYVRTVACRAVATACGGPAGPVHLNCPVREPLVPGPGESVVIPPGRPGGQPYLAVSQGHRVMAARQVAALADSLTPARRGLLICGPQDDPTLAEPVTTLAAALGYPILADPLSGVRCGSHDRSLVIDAYDAFLRDAALVERLAPEVIIRFGAMPTSKQLLLYLQRYQHCRQIIVDGDGGWNDPTLLATEMVHATGDAFCTALVDALPPTPRTDWAAAWTEANRLTRAALTDRFDAMDELFEGKVFAELAALLPVESVLYAGNSMPVRDLDAFFGGNARAMRLVGNRGANGIDGVVSTALGASAGGASPLVLVIGDLSFLHDANGLLAARHHQLNATIIVLNNDGGGIFSFLPQAALPEHYETLWGTPHGLDLRPLADLYGATYTRVTDWPTFQAAVRSGIAQAGLSIVEVPTERQRNVTLHRELWRVVADALGRSQGVAALAQ